MEGFKNYGGRGIQMAPEWVEDFVAFRDYVNQNLGPRPKGGTIDRINNDEGYFPGNIRWATRSVQSNNTRCTKLGKILSAFYAELKAAAELNATPAAPIRHERTQARDRRPPI
jgi:hypothetical protein